MAPPNADGRVVLRGPKSPAWSCKQYDRTANRVSRIVCACGAKSPADDARKARLADEKAAARHGDQQHRHRQGGGGAFDLSSVVEALRKEMRQELSTFKGTGARQNKAPPAPEASQPSEDDSLLGQIEALEATLAGFKRTKYEGPLVAQTEAALAALRAQRPESKAPLAQTTSINGRLQRLRRKLTKLEQVKEDKEAAVGAARQALEEAEADRDAHLAEITDTSAAIAEAEREVQQAVQRAKQKELVAEVIAANPLGQQLGAWAAGILEGLLGKVLAKAAPP
ncbi:unnamed protein product, partial [Prorocentrum cordatum]